MEESNNKADYKRVSCDFYDQLEIGATYGKVLLIKYKDEDNMTLLTESSIKTLETKDKEEFVILDNGLRIRLDRIITLNEI